MAFYLVDYENVNTDGLQGVELLTAADEVIIFYSEYADRLTFELHQRINESKAQVHYFKVGACKKNALDFQLVSYLGYLIARHPGQAFYIISHDTGFQSVVRFWAEQQIPVTQVGALCPSQEQAPPRQSQETLLQRQMETLFPGDAALAAIVTACLQRSKSKQELHNALAAELRDDSVGEIYKKIKHLL